MSLPSLDFGLHVILHQGPEALLVNIKRLKHELLKSYLRLNFSGCGMMISVVQLLSNFRLILAVSR